MNRVGVLLACGLSLAGCSSFAPGNLLGGGYPLKLESNPPGAEATTSLGPACQTPCTLAVPASSDFTVAFALPGYEPQTVPIAVIRSGGFGSVGATAINFDPNPVAVELQRAAPVKPAKKKRPAKTKARAAAPPAARPPAASEVPPAQRTIPGAQPTVPASAFPPPR